jgi:hypothetical protein
VSEKVFELLWCGGPPEERLRKRRPGADELPWGTLDLAHVDPQVTLEARKIWTNGVFTEYASAAAFASFSTALLECGAPVDLSAMAADIVVDELFHVELSSRLVTELGGATPLVFDLANVSPKPTPGARPIMRAAEIAMTTSCVSESLSVPAMARSKAIAKAPLVHAVLDRLVADEGPHARIGFWFLDWAADLLTEEEKKQLAELAVTTIAVYAPLWQGSPCDACPVPTGYAGHDEIGREALRKAVRANIARPLAEHGIVLDEARIAQLTA